LESDGKIKFEPGLFVAWFDPEDQGVSVGSIQQSMRFFRKIVYAIAAISVPVPAVYAAPGSVFADKYAAIVIDASSGKTLFEEKANVRRYPASLTKMMTLYLLFEAMQSGRISRNTPIPVSAYAASQPPTKMGLSAGQKIAAETAAKTLITRSANDIATAVGEYLGGSEKKFARMMTAKARRLGMMNTNFTNASGLPDTQNYSTARDMAILALALREHFPEQYRLFNIKSFIFHGKTIDGHNQLVKSMEGVDGIKTGYTRMSGFNLASSMRSEGKSVVAVVMGGRTAALRDAHMADLLGRYMEKASNPGSKKAAEPLVASREIEFSGKRKTVPIPIAKASVNKVAVADHGSKGVVMSDRERDSAFLTALASQDFPSSAAAAAADGIIIKNPPLPIRKIGDDIDPVAVSSAADKKKGWIIQIASLPSRNEASQILDKASSTVRAVLAEAEPYMQFFEKGASRYYRARFSGFPSRRVARDACSELEKAHFQCYALKN